MKHADVNSEELVTYKEEPQSIPMVREADRKFIRQLQIYMNHSQSQCCHSFAASNTDNSDINFFHLIWKLHMPIEKDDSSNLKTNSTSSYGDDPSHG